MPLNRRSQARRAHIEQKSKERTAKAFDKEAREQSADPIKEATKKKRGSAKKR